ncbi:MAG TPA: ATP-binding protein, partial [Coxiellaceae bacterium]|nr:ATP-binding protein [Coxiellaceae bacterium]
GVYLGCNAGALEIVNVSSRDQIIGKTNHDFARWQHWPEGLADSIDEAERKIITTKKPLENIEDGPFKTKNNPAVYQLTNKVPLFDREKNVIGILGISIDITERKRAQDNEKLALQKSAADQAMKRAMLVFSGMSTHDLRTPLSSINLCASFLNKHLTTLIEAYKTAAQNNLAITPIRDKTLTDIQQIPNDIMQSVHEANNYIDSSLKSLKGASNGEELMDEAQLAECNAERLLRRVIDTYPYKEGQASLLHYNADCDFSFQGNVIFFNRLIENLIKNAFEQIQIKGHGEIFISCGQEENFNIIKIKDTAGGVTQEIIDTLFSGIQSSKNGGTGIGLSSAKQIMYSMRGDVSCRLVEGDCIEFVLSFPLSDVKNLGSFIA